MVLNKFTYHLFLVLFICLMNTIGHSQENIEDKDTTFILTPCEKLKSSSLYYINLVYYPFVSIPKESCNLYFRGSFENWHEYFSFFEEFRFNFSESEAPYYDKYKNKFDTAFFEQEEITNKKVGKIKHLAIDEDTYSGYLKTKSFDDIKINIFKKININDFKIKEISLSDAFYFYSKLYDEILKKTIIKRRKSLYKRPFR